MAFLEFGISDLGFSKNNIKNPANLRSISVVQFEIYNLQFAIKY